MAPQIIKIKACIGCRTRKVKCDRLSPCTNCSRWSIPCTYPPSVRKCQRKPRREEHEVTFDAENSDRHFNTSSSATPTRNQVSAENSSAEEQSPIKGSQFRKCWEYFFERVDPVIKILHRPSTARILDASAKNPSSLKESERALVHAIYFSGIACMSHEEVNQVFDMTKETATEVYRLSTEEALAKVVLLNMEEDLVALQALVLFLSVSNLTGKPKVAWKLTGIARRFGMFSQAGLSPFQTEMRNRLWWQLWYLDHRAAKDLGQRDGAEGCLAFELPLNVNDSDLDPSSSHLINPRNGWSEQTFALVRYGIAQTRQMLSEDIVMTRKEEIIRDCEKQLHDHHLQFCIDQQSPIQWLTRHVAHVLVMEMWFELYGADTIDISSVSLADEGQHEQGFRDFLFLSAIDIIDTTTRLESEPESRQWAWLLRGYQQFRPLVFLLNELQYREQCAAVDHAWKVVESALSRWPPTTRDSANGRVMKNLKGRAGEIQRRLSKRIMGRT